MPKVNEFNCVKKGMFFFMLSLFSFSLLQAQQNGQSVNQNREELSQFAKRKSTEWTLNKTKADSLANVLKIPLYYVENDSNKVVILQRLGRNNKPVYYATDNVSVATTISVDDVWATDNEYPALTGEGVEINLWDGGRVLSTHQEFKNGPGSRIIMRDLELPLSNHSTHIAGTMIATGVNPDAKGMAGKAIIKDWDLNDDIAEMSGAAADGIVVSNHSYGPLCGWYYNSTNESWYWYGDPEISATEDYEFGFYNQVSADVDYIAQLAPNYLIVKSTGNDRNDAPETSFLHYVWDEKWVLVNVEREHDGGTDGYDCLSPMAVAKNILTVGAVDDAKAMTTFSAYGPTDDGRIKPDVVANGYDVFSAISSADNSYGTYNGTSMSTASASGSVALLHQLQNTLQPGVQLHSSTIKGILIHTASDLGNTGPDYRFGWGILDIKKAADLIYTNSNNQGKNIYEKVLNDGEVVTIPVKTTSSAPFLKATLCWTDPAGQPSSPALNPRTKKLVNDLDIKIVNSSTLQSYYPWVLNVENPSASATPGVNHVDNVEQVYIANPGNNNFNIKISHSGTLTRGSQMFSLIISGIETLSNIFPPQNLSCSINESSILLSWNSPVSGTPTSYKIYRNDALLAEIQTTDYTDKSIIPDNKYTYYVTAVYNINNVKIESLGTNEIFVYPQTLRTLPFIVDFETLPTEVVIKNNEVGWQWGDSESLNCYYLNFSENTTKFIGIDSYSAGEAVHVSDIAITAPLRLADYSNIVLSFNYLLKTGIYDAIDELHVVYKLQEEKEWHELVKLESSFKWKFKSIELPPEMCKNGTQIGFYYDDLYQWGMGAGLDNIKIAGVPVSLTLDLKFKQGWNIFSINSLPYSVDLMSIFQTLIDNNSLVKIQDELGNSMEDLGTLSGWQNNIGDISTTEGYKVKVNFDESLKISGTPVKYPFAIPLKTGWNIAGYPQQISNNGMIVLQQLIEKGVLVKVQDECGNSIEELGIYGGWKNNIGNFIPGEGYKIKVSADEVLWIYENYPKTTTIVNELVPTNHFEPVFVGNGVDHMNINLVGLPTNLLNEGDEFAIFDGTICTGAITLTAHHLQSQVIAIVASASDYMEKTGFTVGNPFIFKHWSVKQNQEIILEPEIVKGPSVFIKHATTIASIEKYTTTGFDEIPVFNIAEINCFPNPFTEEITIEIYLKMNAKVRIDVINQLGQTLRTIVAPKLMSNGSHKFIWNGRNAFNKEVSPGFYLLQIGIDDSIIHRKIVLAK